MNSADLHAIRDRLLELPDFSAASADQSPKPDDMYAPREHAAALDPERALVVGGRGVGKSFWSSVLYGDQTRDAAAEYYPKLNLRSLSVSLGFHENVRGSESIAPTKNALAAAIENNSALNIWRTVLLRALIAAEFIARDQISFEQALEFAKNHSDELDDLLIQADANLKKRNKRFLLVFDALDRLSNDWGKITKLTEGIAQLALDLRGFTAIRAKLFVRRDQYENGEAFRFRDASKLTNARVELFWTKEDLFGWLFQWLWRSNTDAFKKVVATIARLSSIPNEMPDALTHNEEEQRAVFASLAGPYMGADRRRGMTDRKIVNSIADAFGEPSLRSFSAAIKTAAEDAKRRGVDARPLDHLALNEGIVKASKIRLEELKEDHGWIELALEPLQGLTVPCEQKEFENRWKQKKTIKEITTLNSAGEKGPSTPIAFTRGESESSLIGALEDIGVVDIREDERLNVPDLFRVAAGIGRKGGVKSARRQ